MTQRIIIDTDPGVDDALTFLLALASPEIKLEALTTTQGNVTLEKATRNALSILELCHATHIPVVAGSMYPLVQPLRASAHMISKTCCLAFTSTPREGSS